MNLLNIRKLITFSLSLAIAFSSLSSAWANPATPAPIADAEVITVKKSDPAKSLVGVRNTAVPDNLISNGDAEIDPNRIIVSFKSKPSSQAAVALQQKYSVEKSTAIEIIGKSNQLYAEVWHLKSAGVKPSLTAIRSEAAVKSVQNDIRLKISAIPNDPGYSQTWGMAKINAPTAWNTTTGSNSVVAAVIDTGIDLDHPDLVANLWVNANEIPNNNIDDDNNGYIDDIHGWDFVDSDAVPNDDVSPSNWSSGHGTHVAGTIAGVGNNSLGVAGVAWQAKLMALRICGPGGCYLSDHVSALAYAYANGAEIANESFGGNYRGYDFEREALAAIAEPGDTPLKKGVLVVAAAGNSAVDTDQNQFHPANYRLPNLVSVAATADNAENSLAGFSNYGVSGVDVAAPGNSIYSTLPEGAFNTSGGYGFLSGTSMAAPHTAGLAVLIKSRFPNYTAAQLRLAIVGSVTQYPALATKVFSGGMIDAAKAVALTQVPLPKIHLRLVGTGLGTLNSNVGSCDQSDCIFDLTSNSVSVTAIPAVGSALKSWHTNNCAATQTSCAFTNFGVSPVIKVKFSAPAISNAVETELISSPSTPVFTNSSATSQFNLVNSQLSGSGEIRAKAVFRQPENAWCYYVDSDTGGVTIEEKQGGTWSEVAKFTAPYVTGSEPRDRWANCGQFGKELHLSQDGSTLAVGLGVNFYPNFANPAADYLKCGAAIYRKVSGTWTYQGVVMPADKADCLETFYRNSNEMAYQYAFNSMKLSATGDKLYVGSVSKLRVFDISNLANVMEYEYALANNCDVAYSSWNNWRNISVNTAGNLILVLTVGCTTSSGAQLIGFQNGSFQLVRDFTEIDSRMQRSPYAGAISPNGNTVAISYSGNASGVVLFESNNGSWVQRLNLNNQPGFAGYTHCFQFNLDASKLICDSQFVDLGRNLQQGKIQLATRLGSSWSSGAALEPFWMTEGNSYDWLRFLTADANLTMIDAGISSNAMGSGAYPDDLMGATFSYNLVGPVNLVNPGLTGSNLQGSTLTGTPGTWQAPTSISYSNRWLRCGSATAIDSCSPINGATSTTYQSAAADNGQYLRFETTATANGLARSAVSVASAQIATQPNITGNITLTGNTAVGAVLTASAPTATGAPAPVIGYQWFSCTARDTRQATALPTGCTAISGATQSSYQLTTDQAGRYLRVMVSATNAAGSRSIYSITTRAAIAAAPVNMNPPGITGNAVVGQTLTGNAGSWQSTPAARYTYNWLRCSTTELTSCVQINGATRTSYRLVAADSGFLIRFRVTATNSVGSSIATSAGSSNIQGAPVHSQTISITGTARVGQTISASNINWSGFPTPAVSYQWYSCTAQNRTQSTRPVRNCQPISGANQLSYTITSAELNRFLLIVTTGTNTAGSSSVWSASTIRITN